MKLYHKEGKSETEIEMEMGSQYSVANLEEINFIGNLLKSNDSSTNENFEIILQSHFPSTADAIRKRVEVEENDGLSDGYCSDQHNPTRYFSDSDDDDDDENDDDDDEDDDNDDEDDDNDDDDDDDYDKY